MATTPQGNHVVVAVHGGGIYASPERFERTYRASVDRSNPEGFDEVAALGGSVACILHWPIAATDTATDAALDAVRTKWQGPICVYPEVERHDYVETYRDDKVATPITPDEYVAWATDCVAAGVQIVDGCCGIEVDHIRPLRDALPTHLP